MTLLISATLSFAASAATVGNTIGQIYDIAEPDALSEIESRVRSVDWSKEMNKNRESWHAFRGVPLPVAKETRTRSSMFPIKRAVSCIRKGIRLIHYSMFICPSALW